MKQINNYLLEKLKISKNTSLVSKVSVDLPKVEDFTLYKNEKWKTLVLPTDAYIIFKDKYRGDLAHFANTQDFVTSLLMLQDDYEDFDIHKDILYASNDLKDILEWYFEYLNISECPTEDDIDDWTDKYDNVFNSKSNDNCYIIASIYTGIDNYYDGMKPITSYKETIEEIINDIGFDEVK